MLDTCNVIVTAAEELKSISIRLDNEFRKYGLTKVSNDDSEAVLNLKGHWINKIKLKSKGYAVKTTEIYINFSYPRFFHKDNVHLITTEQERQKVNLELLNLVKKFSGDYSLKMRNIKYLRIDVAHQFEDIFEDYNLVFALVYETFVKSLGKENKKSKKYTQIEEDKDYTTGFTYEKGHSYKIIIYNKTAQTSPTQYTPGEKSIIRVEQMFTPRSIKATERAESLALDKLTMKKMKECYSNFLENKIFTYINYVLEQKNIELKSRINNILNTSSKTLPADIKDMQHLILDFEMVKEVIKNADISVKERMKRYYVSWVKESLFGTEENGSNQIKFFDNFKRLEKLTENILAKKTKIKFIQNIPKIEIES